MRNLLAGLIILLGLASPALAQSQFNMPPPAGVSVLGVQVVASCGAASLNTTQPAFVVVDTTGKLCTAASVSASITGFPTTQTTGTPISVTTSGVTGTLPAGAVVVASNVGTTNGAYCKLGASATTSDQFIAPSSWFAFTVGASTQLTCITSTSTTTVNMVGGSGLPTGAGGGGGAGTGSIVTPGATSSTLTTWTSAVSTTQSVFTTGGWPAALIQLVQTTPFSAGAITVEGSYDQTNWVTVPASNIFNAALGQCSPQTNPYTFTANTNQSILVINPGYQAVRIRNSTGITGAGTVTPFVTLLSIAPFDPSICNPLAAGSAIVGKFGIDQSGPGTTNAVAGSANMTPTDCSLALTTGTTAQNIITAGASLHGFTIANIDTSEVMWMSFTTTAAPSTIGSYPLAPATATTFSGLSSYTTPLGFGTNANVSVVAATTGHKISCTKW